MKYSIQLRMLLVGPLVLLAVTADAKPQPISAQDAAFLKKVNGANLAEAGFTPVVLKNSQSPSAKEFAQRMVHDHMNANDAVKALAAKKNVTLPGVAPAAARAKVNSMRHEKGKTFDADYKTVMIADHHEAIALFREEVKKGTDPDVKAFASKTLPTLQEHLKMAQAMK